MNYSEYVEAIENVYGISPMELDEREDVRQEDLVETAQEADRKLFMQDLFEERFD